MIRTAEHAVERFVEYFRPGMSFAEAQEELRRLVAAAARTRRNTLPGNARIYIGHTERGERICIALPSSTTSRLSACEKPTSQVSLDSHLTPESPTS